MRSPGLSLRVGVSTSAETAGVSFVTNTPLLHWRKMDSWLEGGVLKIHHSLSLSLSHTNTHNFFVVLFRCSTEKKLKSLFWCAALFQSNWKICWWILSTNTSALQAHQTICWFMRLPPLIPHIISLDLRSFNTHTHKSTHTGKQTKPARQLGLFTHWKSQDAGVRPVRFIYRDNKHSALLPVILPSCDL